jgi:glutamine amidotransferase
LFSLGQALNHLGFEHRVTAEPADLESADRIVFPGVGAFGDAMQGLRDRKLVQPLLRAAARGVPILGICVGCQLLLSRGEEFGDHEGLGLIPGTVSRLPSPRADDPTCIRIPNVGWRALDARPNSRVLGKLGPSQMMYFVHSYAPRPENDAHVSASIAINGENVAVAVERDNIAGVQFHPEKSGPVGLALLAHFLSQVGENHRPAGKAVRA